MEKEILTNSNRVKLIPTILKNAEEIRLNKNISHRHQLHEILSSLPTPSDEELDHLFYSHGFCSVLQNHLADSQSGAYSRPSVWQNEVCVTSIASYYILNAFSKDSNAINDVFLKTNSEELLIRLIRSNIQPDLKTMQSLVDRKGQELQLLAVGVADNDGLIKLTKSSWDVVRAKAYSRLGPINYLDEMLLDRSKKVRILAIELMPYGYTVPQKALADRAFYTFYKLLEKVSIDQIPMLLGNKNLEKNLSIKNILQKRLDLRF